MLDGLDPQQAMLAAGGVGGTIIGAAFFLRSIVAKWIGLGTAIDSENARKDIVELLREQIDELVEENRILREERLASAEENSQLKAMVKTLEIKVEFLQESIDKLRKGEYNHEQV